MKNAIKNKMSPALKKLLKDQDNPNGTFTIDIQKGTDVMYFVAYIKGKISGDDNLKELSDILNDFQGKSECMRMIYFLPNQTSTTADSVPGFEWSSCEYPMHVCPNGECCQDKDSNTNTNTHPGPSPTANSNGNSNSNAGRAKP